MKRGFSASFLGANIALGLILGQGGDALAAEPAPANASPTQGVATPDTNAAPHIQFDSTSYDFGKVKSGEVVKHAFIFTNTGASTLEILDVRPGCGCTTAGTWDKKVEPGRTGSIPLQFNSTGFGGMLAKSATVTCNDPRQTNLFLQLRGTVWKPVDVTPAMAIFNISADVQTNETKVLRITNNMEAPVTLSELKSGNPAFQAELKTLKEGKEFELHVTAVPPFTNNTVFSSITLKTSSPEVPVLNVTVYAVLQPPFTTIPATVMLPPGPYTNPFTTSVTIRRNGTNAWILSDPQADAPGVQAQLKETQPGQVYTLSATFPTDFALAPGMKAELSLRSTNPKFPVIKVPVFQSRPVVRASAAAPSASPAAQLLMPASPATQPMSGTNRVAPTRTVSTPQPPRSGS